MKSRIAPNMRSFQIEVLDYKHRQPPPDKDFYVDKYGRGIREIVDHIPIITLFRRAKKAKQAIKSASKIGSVISCRKVDSHFHRLDMISHLRIDLKPIEVDISVEEFTVGRNLEIEPEIKLKQVDVK